MATNTIRIDDGIKEETSRIADAMGLSFNAVVNIMLRKFNAVKGFPFAVCLETSQDKTVFDLNSDEFEAACRRAVEERELNPTMEYVTLIDRESGQLIKKYQDGRVEYVLD